MLDEINPYIDDLKTDPWSFPSNSNENNFKIILLILIDVLQQSTEIASELKTIFF